MIAALDCSRDDLALVSFYHASLHTQQLQKPSFTLSQSFILCSTLSAKCANLIFIWPNGITLSVLLKNNLQRVGIKGCSTWVEKHASSLKWTWPSFIEFNFFSLRIYLPSYSLMWCFWVHSLKYSTLHRIEKARSHSYWNGSSPISMDVMTPLAKRMPRWVQRKQNSIIRFICLLAELSALLPDLWKKKQHKNRTSADG